MTIRWAEHMHLLGTMPDRAVAEQLGCSTDAVRVARQKHQVPAHRENRRWTSRDDDLLRWHWGHLSIQGIGKKLKRTPTAVAARAGHLHLGVANRGMITVAAAERLTGWNRDALKRAAEHLNLTISRHPPTMTRSRAFTWTLIDEMDARKCANWLDRHGGKVQRPYERWLKDTEVLGALPATSKEAADRLQVGLHHARQALRRLKGKGLVVRVEKHWAAAPAVPA